MTEVGKGTHDAIVRLLAAQDAAWDDGDADRFGASVLPDVVFTNVVGLFSVGAEPFIAQHAHIFATIYKGSRLDQRLVRITMASGDVAVVNTLTSVTNYHHLPPGAEPINGAFQTRLQQVLVYRESSWRVQSFHNTAINPVADTIRASQVGSRHELNSVSPKPTASNFAVRLDKV